MSFEHNSVNKLKILSVSIVVFNSVLPLLWNVLYINQSIYTNTNLNLKLKFFIYFIEMLIRVNYNYT